MCLLPTVLLRPLRRPRWLLPCCCFHGCWDAGRGVRRDPYSAAVSLTHSTVGGAAVPPGALALQGSRTRRQRGLHGPRSRLRRSDRESRHRPPPPTHGSTAPPLPSPSCDVLPRISIYHAWPGVILIPGTQSFALSHRPSLLRCYCMWRHVVLHLFVSSCAPQPLCLVPPSPSPCS